MSKPKSEQSISVPEFLGTASAEQSTSAAPRCDFCTQVACETDAMACGQCTGQTCAGQCSSAECGQGGCGSCQTCMGCEGASCQDNQGPTYVKATFSVTGVTQTTARINVAPGSGYTSFKVLARYRDNSTVVYEWEFEAAAPFYADISGLTPGTWYAVNVCSIAGDKKDWGTRQDFQAVDTDRPSYFSWKRGLVSSQPSTNELSRGGSMPPYLDAAGWNSYTSNINDVMEYRGLSHYNFTAAVAGRTELSAAMVNQAINAINAMSPPISPPSLATAMSTSISAILLNKLVDSLNSVT